MTSVLITAFEPYDKWQGNSSWSAVVELTRELPSAPRIVTRRYPVDFDQTRSRLEKDLSADFDYVFHLGQAPGRSAIELESIAVNVGTMPGEGPAPITRVLEPAGPVAYQSRLPLAQWAADLRRDGIPTIVSYHAGTYLCNAMLYWTMHLTERQGWKTKATFVHLPLTPEQVVNERSPPATMSATTAATALRKLLAAVLEPAMAT